jgi:hypothetical protein
MDPKMIGSQAGFIVQAFGPAKKPISTNAYAVLRSVYGMAARISLQY